MKHTIHRLSNPDEYRKAKATDLIELLPVPGSHPLFVPKGILESLVAGIALHECIHLSGPTGSSKSSLLHALTEVPHNFQTIRSDLGFPELPLKVYPIPMVLFETPGEFYQRRSLQDGNTFDEKSSLLLALENAAQSKGRCYPLVWLKEFGRLHAVSLQGGLTDLMSRDDIEIPDGTQIDGRGISWIADSNYQAEKEYKHSLIALDDALKRRFTVNVTLDYLTAEQEMMVLEHFGKEQKWQGTEWRHLARQAVQLGSAVRKHRSEGCLLSVVPPSIHGYLGFLRMSLSLPHLDRAQIAAMTLLGNASQDDQKHVDTVCREVFGTNGLTGAHLRELKPATKRKGETKGRHKHKRDPQKSPEDGGKTAGGSKARTGASEEGSGPSLGSIPVEAPDSHDAPLQDSPTRHHIEMPLGNGSTVNALIFDQPALIRTDPVVLDSFLRDVRPIAKSIRRRLAGDHPQDSLVERLQSSGVLDGTRLPVAQFSSTAFKRIHDNMQRDEEGNPVLLIATDGSGSLDCAQMRIVKLLLAAWLEASTGSDLQILAALFNSGPVDQGRSAPLVHWVYHPSKLPGMPRSRATVASLSDSGTGVQSDALSIYFMLEQALQFAQGERIHLLLVTDTEWNRSFSTEKTGEEEVYACLETFRSRLAEQIHTTLVALGVDHETGLEGVVQKVFKYSAKALSDPRKVVEEVSGYVADAIRNGGSDRLYEHGKSRLERSSAER